MSLRNQKSARTTHPLDSLFSPALLSRFLLASAPAGLESVGNGEKSRTIMVVDDLLADAVPPVSVVYPLQDRSDAKISRMPTQRWRESDLLERGRFASVGPVPYKRCVALSFVDEVFHSDAEISERITTVLDFAEEGSRRRKKIPTGSPAVAEKLPAWEANARRVLAGAKRWAQLRWGLL